MTINKTYILALGAACAGAAIAWDISKRYYEGILTEMREHYRKRLAEKDKVSDSKPEPEKKPEPKPEPKVNPDMRKYEDIVKRSYHGVYATEPQNLPEEKIYVVSPEEWGDNPDYEKISLTYYADGVLADENDKPEKVKDTIGEESLKHFGDYEADIVTVQNDILGVYYEVCRDHRKYTDVVAEIPDRPKEDE